MSAACLWADTCWVCLAAGEEKLKHAVERLLDGVDAVIYVLDFTKLKTSSEVRCAAAHALAAP